MVKFKKGDLVRITETHRKFTKGEVVKVIDIDRYDEVLMYLLGNDEKQDWASELFIELIKSKPTKNQRITDLETTVKSLENDKLELQKAIEEQIKWNEEQRKFNDEIIKKFTNVYSRLESPFGTEVGRNLEAEYAEQVKQEKTPNQLRAEIIEKAKGFVDENGGDDYHFDIDEKNGTVFAYKVIISGVGRYSVKYGLSKCHPDDVFNTDIGKAIAFGRAEKKDVSEFEQAVQPTFEVGQIIEFINYVGEIESFRIVEVEDEKVWFICNEGHETYIEKSGSKTGNGTYKPTIINDTNAIYSEVSE